MVGGGLNNTPSLRGLTLVSNIPAGSEVLVSSFTFADAFPSYGLEISGCQGRVTLESTSVLGSIINGIMWIHDSADVACHYCAMGGFGAPFMIERSRVRLNSCTIHPNLPWAYPFPGYAFTQPGAGLAVGVGAEVEVQGCRIYGAPESRPGSSPGYLATEAVLMQGGTLAIGPYSEIINGPCPNWGCNAPFAGFGTVRNDPTASMIGLPSPTRWPIVVLPPMTQIVEPMQDIFLAEVIRERSYTARVAAPGFTLGLLALSPSVAQPIPLPFGELWLDPCSMWVLGVGVMNSSGILDLTLQASGSTAMDQTYTMQGAAMNAAGELRLTRPARFSVTWAFGRSWP
jgi:hypothetical protein